MSTRSVDVVRCLLIVLIVAGPAAAQRSTDSLLTTQYACETRINASVDYYACIAGPEHVLAPGITAFNVTIEPLASTCGATPQQSCTLVYGMCFYIGYFLIPVLLIGKYVAPIC